MKKIVNGMEIRKSDCGVRGMWDVISRDASGAFRGVSFTGTIKEIKSMRRAK